MRYFVSTCPTRTETSNALDINPGPDVDGRVVRNPQDTRITIQVLVEGQLEDRSSTVPVRDVRDASCAGGIFLLPGDDRRHGQEIDPDPVPPVTVLLDDLVLVTDPVLVPAVDSCRVVDTKNIDVFNLKSSRFELVDNPAK